MSPYYFGDNTEKREFPGKQSKRSSDKLLATTNTSS